jgi:putative ABC transport system permease protein
VFLLKLIFRNCFRHPLRAGLTVAGVAVAVLAFGMLRTLVGLWYLGVESSSANRLVSRNAISLVFSLPVSYRDRIRQIPAVTAVSCGNWFGGMYGSERNFFPNFAIEPRTYLGLYPEFVLSKEETEAFAGDRKGAIVGRKTAERFGWKPGDQVTLKGTIFPGQWDFTVRGIYHGARKGTDETQFLFQWDYLNETLKKTIPRRANQAGFYVIGVGNADAAAEVSRSVDALFRNSLAETLTETERAFQMGFVSMSEAIMIAIRIVSYMVIVIIMVVAANTMAMTARERLSEFATLKSLGFGPLHIAEIVFGESLLLALAGGVVGVLATFPAAEWIEAKLGQFFPIFSISPTTIGLDLLAALVVGIVAGIFPTLRGSRIGIADGLRRIG